MAWAQHQTDFYNKVWTSVQKVARDIGVSAEIIFAQLALESNWGRSELTRTANNFGGIKAVGDQPYVIRRTREVFNGVSQYVQARFRRYDSVQEGIEGYGKFITENPRYRSFIGANNLDAELAAIQASGYATDPQYSAKLKRVIDNMPFQSSGTGSAPNTTGNSFLDSLQNGIIDFATTDNGAQMGDLLNGVTDTVTGPFKWVEETFTMRNGSRLISIVIGIALIIVAIVVLANSSDSLKLEAPSPVGA